MRRLVLSVLAISFIVFSAAAFTQQTNAAQDQHGARSTTSPKLDDSMQDMQGMQHDSVDKKSEKFIDKILHHDTAGTSAQPNSINEPMIMRVWGKWMLMFHGTAFLNALQQSGPRGYDKAFSTNWFMPMAQRQIGRSQLTLRTMFSLEPATVTERFYPLLFQQGETAFGKPINDGQHPHDFFMELAALYDLPLGHNALLSVYAAPVGDPAMGPSAYAHRASASENPVATLGHRFRSGRFMVNAPHGAAGPELERAIFFCSSRQPGAIAPGRRRSAHDRIR